MYLAPSGLPDTVRRVAVLPLIPSRGNRDAERGLRSMQAVFTEEFSRNRQVDVVTITTDRLERMFGRAAFMPMNRCRSISSRACSRKPAAKRCCLPSCPPSAPIPSSLGLEITFVRPRNRRLIWAVDEVFDGGEAAVDSLASYIRKSHASPSVRRHRDPSAQFAREMGRFSIAEMIPTLMKKILKSQRILPNTIAVRRCPENGG